jgi:peptidoglycan hydrolase CwlO-like protein
MIFALFVMITALSISAVAIYYSVSGLVAIFAAAAIPIIIMGTALEVGKLVTAVWLHWYWHKAKWWLKTYLSISVLVLMFITSMGIFGFLSKAHIEQTAAAEEGIANIVRIDEEVLRQEALITRAEQRIDEAEASVGKGNEEIQAQIDKEQTRIDTAYERIQPAIDEQNQIIQTQLKSLEDRVAVYEEEIASLDNELGRLNKVAEQYRQELDSTSVTSIEAQVQPYNEQLAKLDADLERINTQANEYETRITNLQIDNSAIESLKTRVAVIEENIVVVTNKLQSTERDKIKEGQAIIGVTSDGLFGGNTTRAYNAWLEAQRARINELQAQETGLRTQAQSTLDAERNRLTAQVKDLRGAQTDNITKRKQGLLDAIDQIRKNSIDDAKIAKSAIQSKIDTVLNTDIPANRSARQTAQEAITALRQADDIRINAARQSIKDLRSGADAQIAASNNLIQKLRDSLTVGKDADVEALVEEQQKKIVNANNTIDNLTEQKYALQAEYRKLEAEVGPIKYLAEFIYGETDKDILEEAVRWVIITIIFVFDPLAVLLLIASQATIEMRRDSKGNAARQKYEQLRAARILENTGYHPEKSNDNESNDNKHVEHAQPRVKQDRHNETESTSDAGTSEVEHNDSREDERDPTDDRTSSNGGSVTTILSPPEQEERRQELEVKEEDSNYRELKQNWKQDNPEDTLKRHKEAYIIGKIDTLPWESYKQNSEQTDDSIWQRIKDNDED